MAIIKRTKKIYSKLEMPSNSELKEDQIVPGIILKQICSSLWKVEKNYFQKQLHQITTPWIQTLMPL